MGLGLRVSGLGFKGSVHFRPVLALVSGGRFEGLAHGKLKKHGRAFRFLAPCLACPLQEAATDKAGLPQPP